MFFLPLQITQISFGNALLVALFGFALVIVVLAVLAVFVKLLSAVVGKFSASKAAPESEPVKKAPAEQKVTVREEPQQKAESEKYSGYVTLDGVKEQDAAVIMAITSEKTGIPLDRLAFTSIKRIDGDPELSGVSEQDAAVIMAITANKLGKPLENLKFEYIRLVEE